MQILISFVSIFRENFSINYMHIKTDPNSLAERWMQPFETLSCQGFDHKKGVLIVGKRFACYCGGTGFYRHDPVFFKFNLFNSKIFSRLLKL